MSIPHMQEDSITPFSGVSVALLYHRNINILNYESFRVLLPIIVRLRWGKKNGRIKQFTICSVVIIWKAQLCPLCLLEAFFFFFY